MQEPLVVVILGSESDRSHLDDSKMLDVLKEMSVSYEVSIISAHRNPQQLEQYCQVAVQRGVKLFIGAAGMSAALPGAIASTLAMHNTVRPVIGVPLPSGEYPDAQDALLSMVRMPPGMPVAVCGIGKSGFRNAALMACQILSLDNDQLRGDLQKYVIRTTKPAQVGIITSEKESNDGSPA